MDTLVLWFTLPHRTSRYIGWEGEDTNCQCNGVTPNPIFDFPNSIPSNYITNVSHLSLLQSFYRYRYRSCFWYPDFRLLITKGGEMTTKGEMTTRGATSPNECFAHFFCTKQRYRQRGRWQWRGSFYRRISNNYSMQQTRATVFTLHATTTITTTVLHINDIYNRQTEHFKSVCGYKPGLRYLHRIQAIKTT